MKIKFKKGFTLIELMVVVIIIAILTSIVMASFAQAKAKSRDAKRISDLAQLQLALELGFDKCNSFPQASTVNGIHVLVLSSVFSSSCFNPARTNSPYVLSDFISRIPTDPNGSNYVYEVYSSRFDYRLMATLETMTGVVAGGVTGNIGQALCSTGNNYCVAPR
jgi:type II secretion system protein G